MIGAVLTAGHLVQRTDAGVAEVLVAIAAGYD